MLKIVSKESSESVFENVSDFRIDRSRVEWNEDLQVERAISGRERRVERKEKEFETDLFEKHFAIIYRTRLSYCYIHSSDSILSIFFTFSTTKESQRREEKAES